MRRVCAVLAITCGIAHADSPWSEYGATTRLRSAVQVVETACEIDVTLRGAIAEVALRRRIKNTGPGALAAATELEIPSGAQLVALEVQHGNGKPASALAVSRTSPTDTINDASVLGADPAALFAIGDDEQPRYRLVVQPLDADQEALITTRWTRIADIQGGALHVTLPAHGKQCRGVLHATPGPGTSIARVRIGGKETTARTFALAEHPLAIAVELAFRRAQPVVWEQRESLGDGWTAQAITVLTPAAQVPAARRVVFVIDGSRSMELVGRHRVVQVVRAIAGTLPPATSIEAILYDRNASRVFGAWRAPDAQQLAALDAAIMTRKAGNGSDAAAALALARQAIGDADGASLIVLVSDGVFGEIGDAAFAHVLGTPGSVALHAITLTRGRMASPDPEPLYAAIRKVGGSHVRFEVEQLDDAAATLATWLRPSWLDLKLVESAAVLPPELHAGGGVVLTTIAKRAVKPSLALGTTGRAKARIAAAAAPAAPIAELALARALPADVGDEATLVRLRARRPVADETRALVVLASAGKIAKQRREVAASGGPFTRMVALADPTFPPDVGAGSTANRGGSAIDRDALMLLFRTQLQPAAFVCYQRALARAPKLAGTAQFRLEIGRGETTRASVAGLGEPAFDACLVDAAYQVTPPLPNPDYNVDDRTIANYPLTFSVREDKPLVLPGDADSESPLDIDAIQGGLPTRIKAGDTSTPLGNLKVTPTP